MNWRRGFVRIWVLASVAWIGFVAWSFYEYALLPRQVAATAGVCAKASTANPSLGNPFDCYPPGQVFADLIPIGDAAIRYAALALGPVIALGALGLVLGWIVRGCRASPI